MADYTITNLIASLKKRGVVPSANAAFSDSDLMRIFNEVLVLQVVPFIMQVRENYFTDFQDVSIVASTANYQIPTRAIGTKIKNAYFVDQSSRVYELTRIDIDDLPYLFNNNPYLEGIPKFFYLKDNDVNLVPTPTSTTGSIRFYFYNRRNAIVDPSACGVISVIASNVLTVVGASTLFGNGSGKLFDLVKATPPFKNVAQDLTASISTNAVTLTGAVTGLSVGDYLCLAQESPIAQIPYEAFPLLIQRALSTVLRGINDLNGSAKSDAEVAMLEESLRKLLSDRVDESTKKIVSPNNIGQWVLGRTSRW